MTELAPRIAAAFAKAKSEGKAAEAAQDNFRQRAATEPMSVNRSTSATAPVAHRVIPGTGGD